MCILYLVCMSLYLKMRSIPSLETCFPDSSLHESMLLVILFLSAPHPDTHYHLVFTKTTGIESVGEQFNLEYRCSEKKLDSKKVCQLMR